jgi:hypothetical protein
MFIPLPDPYIFSDAGAVEDIILTHHIEYYILSILFFNLLY